MTFRDETYYEVLGTHPWASEDDLRAAYRRRAEEWRPDLNAHRPQEAQRRMAEIAEAFRVLSDPATRRAYDDHLRFAAQRATAPTSGPATFGETLPVGQGWSRSATYPSPPSERSSSGEVLWRGTGPYRRHEAGPGSTMLVGLAAWLIALSFAVPCFAPFLIVGLRFAFFPAGRWVGLRTVLLGMLAWLAIVGLPLALGIKGVALLALLGFAALVKRMGAARA